MKSIVSTLSRYMLSLCFSSIFIFGGLTTYFMINDYENELLEAQNTILGSVENDLSKEVSRIENYISFSSASAHKQAIKEVKDFVLETHFLATTLYEKYKKVIPDEELKRLIKDTLRALTREHGISYLFIVDMDGVEQMNSHMPEMEQVNVYDYKNPDGRYIVREMIDLIKKQGEGYIDYNWTKPGGKEDVYEKKTYIKLFKPYDWFIGTGTYHTNVAQKVQEEVLERLTSINSGKEQYFFAGTYSGMSLLGPGKGKNVIDIQDSNGLKIVQNLIKIAKSGGGFLTYATPSIDPRYKVHRKLSYCTAIPNWEWYIGSGVNIDALEEELNKYKTQLKEGLLINLSIVGALILSFSFTIIFFSEKFKKVLADNFDSFENFFKKGTDSPKKIDRSTIAFTEFDNMAALANSMIDSRESARNELLKSEITYREIFNATKDAIAVMDINKRIFTDVNQAFLDFFGMSRNSAIGMSPAEISFNTPPYDRQYAAELFQRAQSGEVVHFEWMVKNSSGYPFWTDNLARVATIGGEKKLLIVMRDITERKKMQKIMIQTEKMMSIGGLAAGMAHEINNPLGVIMQVTQNIIRRTSPNLKSNLPVAEQCNIDLDNVRNYMDKRGITNYLHGIQDAGSRAAAIVKSMLDFSRQSTSAKSTSDIEEVIETAISLASNDYDLRKQYDFKKIKIIRDYSSPPKFNFTEMEISQVILNIIKNSAQALSEDQNTHKVPTITIRTSTDKQSVRVEIEDNGPGIPAEHLKRIFEPFYSTKGPGQGTGLGLSVSYFIVTQNHGGTITVDSNPGEGTRFTISLPVL